jgi:hypothetical protein
MLRTHSVELDRSVVLVVTIALLRKNSTMGEKGIHTRTLCARTHSEELDRSLVLVACHHRKLGLL